MGLDLGSILSSIGLGDGSGDGSNIDLSSLIGTGDAVMGPDSGASSDITALLGFDPTTTDTSSADEIPMITQGALEPGGAADATSGVPDISGITSSTEGSASSGLGAGGAAGPPGDTGTTPGAAATPGSGVTGGLQKILQGLGLVGADGSINPLAMLYTLGPLLGGLMQYHNTGNAAQQIVAGINNASTAAQNTLGGAASPFTPFVTTGQAAAARAPSLMFPTLGKNSLAGLLKKGG